MSFVSRELDCYYFDAALNINVNVFVMPIVHLLWLNSGHFQQENHGRRPRSAIAGAWGLPSATRAGLSGEHQGVLQAYLELVLPRVCHVPLHLSGRTYTFKREIEEHFAYASLYHPSSNSSEGNTYAPLELYPNFIH